MAYNELLAARVRVYLSGIPDVVEKKMMGGLTFMVNGKMCAGVIKDDLLCRIDPDIFEVALSKKGCSVMQFTGRPMKGFVVIDHNAIENEPELCYWINLALDFNPLAQASKKKKAK